MAMVTEKKRFLQTLTGEGADRFPFFDLEPDEDTLQRWYGQGLPKDVSFKEYFHLETHHSVGLMLRSFPFFQMAPDLLLDPDAFDRHYDPDDPARYDPEFVERTRRLEQEGRIVYMDASGGGLLQMLGVGDWQSFVAACKALMKEPHVVEDLVERTTDFYCVCLERVLSQVSVDYASFYEPIASNTGPVISPALFEHFAIPGYKKVMALLQKFQVPLRILCTTGGNLAPLLPSLVDAGINCFWISNIMSAGMEYNRLRREYGTQVSLIGGIDAAALSRGEEDVRRTVEATVPPLLEKGRYLPCLDDRPRTNIPFDHYRFYRQLLEKMAKEV